MTCPLCQNESSQENLIPHPYWQEESLKLAHAMNPDWDESEGCCKRCFNEILDTVETAWVPTKDYVIRGVSEGYRYVLTKRESGNWNHINPDLQRWWQKKYIGGISEEAIEAGFEEWFVFDAEEKVLAQGRITDL